MDRCTLEDDDDNNGALTDVLNNLRYFKLLSC